MIVVQTTRRSVPIADALISSDETFFSLTKQSTMGQPLPTNDAREHETHSVVSVGEAPGCGSEYRDFSRDCAQSIRKQLPKEKRRGPRGGVVKPFPVRLYNMLDGLQEEGLESIASWQVHGRSFAVHKPNEFVNRVLPK